MTTFSGRPAAAEALAEAEAVLAEAEAADDEPEPELEQPAMTTSAMHAASAQTNSFDTFFILQNPFL